MRMKLFAAVLLIVVAVSITGCPMPYNGVTLFINNYSNDEIIAAYVSPSNSAYWGYNQLEYPIPSGYSTSISGINPGYYDLKANGYWGGEWVAYGIYMDGSRHDWNLLNGKSSKENSSFGPIDGAPKSSVVAVEEFNAAEGGDKK